METYVLVAEVSDYRHGVHALGKAEGRLDLGPCGERPDVNVGDNGYLVTGEARGQVLQGKANVHDGGVGVADDCRLEKPDEREDPAEDPALLVPSEELGGRRRNGDEELEVEHVDNFDGPHRGDDDHVGCRREEEEEEEEEEERRQRWRRR